MMIVGGGKGLLRVEGKGDWFGEDLNEIVGLDF